MSQGDVLNDEVVQQGSFSRTGFSNDVDVLTLIFRGYAKGTRVSPPFAPPDDDNRFVVSWFQNQPPLLSTLKVPFVMRPVESTCAAGRNVWGHAGEVMAADLEIRRRRQ